MAVGPEQSKQPEKEGYVPRLLAGLVVRMASHPRLVLLVALSLCVVSVGLAFTTLQYRTHRNDLISPKKDYLQRWRQYVKEFGNDDDIVVVVQGADHRRMKAALEDLAQAIRREPTLFDRLFYKVDLRALRHRALMYLDTDSIRSIQNNLRSMVLLLEFAPISWKSLGLASLISEANQRVSRVKPEQPLKPGDRQFLTQLQSILQTADRTLAEPDQYCNPWTSLLAEKEEQDLLAKPQYLFSPDGTLAMLLVRPVMKESSFTAARQSVDKLREIVTGLEPTYGDLEFGLTGLPVLETDEMVASQTDTRWASVLALVGVALLYLVVFRSWRWPVLTITTLVVGTIWALGWLTLTVGHLNILSATFAIMLIGMGDYGILWVTRYEQDRAESGTVSEALAQTARRVGPSILTAALTTSLAFYAATLADFQAVAELGWIAGSGILLCAISCFTVMPALIALTSARQEAAILPFPRGNRGWRPALLPGLSRRPRWIIAGGVVLTAMLGFFACRIDYDHNLLNLQAKGLDSVRWEMTLMERMTGTSWHALTVTESREQALALKARYEQLPEVGQVAEVASLIPGQQDEKMPLLKDIQHRLRRLPTRGSVIAHSPPHPGRLQENLRRLVDQVQAPSDPLLRQVRQSAAQLNGRLKRMPANIQTADRLRRFDNHMAGDLAEDLHRLREVARPAVITTADLPVELRERFVGKSGKWLLRVFAEECLWDYGHMERFVQQVQSVDPEATGKPFSTLAGLQSMKHGFIWAGAYSLIAILVILCIDLRNGRQVLLALAPLVMGIVCTLGILSMLGVPLNPANMIAFPLIVGVGVDNGVHVVHDFRSRRRKQPFLLSSTIGRGILVTALTTIIGFGTLMTSTHRGLAGLGLILTIGVACCMISALVFLPAVLRLLGSVDVSREVAVETGGLPERQAA